VVHSRVDDPPSIVSDEVAHAQTEQAAMTATAIDNNAIDNRLPVAAPKAVSAIPEIGEPSVSGEASVSGISIPSSEVGSSTSSVPDTGMDGTLHFLSTGQDEHLVTGHSNKKQEVTFRSGYSDSGPNSIIDSDRMMDGSQFTGFTGSSVTDERGFTGSVINSFHGGSLPIMNGPLDDNRHDEDGMSAIRVSDIRVSVVGEGQLPGQKKDAVHN